MNMTTVPKKLFGYTDTEELLLQEILDGLHAFTATGDAWAQQLPFEVSRSFVLEGYGNPVQFTAQLYRERDEDENTEEYNLFFKNIIQGTDKERWSSAPGGFFLSYGSKEKVAADIAFFRNNLNLVQDKLYQDYYGSFYNS